MGQHNLELIDRTSCPPDDERFLLWIAFLMISPSYLAAYRIRMGLLSYESVKKEIPDIDSVIKIYDDFGDVFTTSTEDWWNNNAYKLFGVDLAAENLKVLLISQRGEVTDKSKLLENVDTYTQHTRIGMGNPLSMIVSIPLDMSKKVILGTISEAIDFYRTNRQDASSAPVINAKYSMAFDRIQTRNLQKLLSLVLFKAANADLPLWQVGMKQRVNFSQAQIARESIEKNERFDDAQNVLSATVSRLLKQARLIAENAARGRFVIDQNVPEAVRNFDYENITEFRAKISDFTKSKFRS